MTDREQCRHCQDYKNQGHNYCRMCGFHLTKGYVQNVKVAGMYDSSEKFCGYCGGPKKQCSCTTRP